MTRYTVLSWLPVITGIGWLLVSTSAAAQVVCQDATDCDGNGVNNAKQACPAGPSLSAEPNRGFSDVRCFEPLLEFSSAQVDEHCKPVAVRRIHETVPLHPLESSSQPGSTTVDGVVFVGVYNTTMFSPATVTKLNPATPSDVADGFRAGQVPPRSLFACMGSASFNTDGSLGPVTWVYGFRVATNYTRAILEAGEAKPKGAFRDALGLFREVRKSKVGWADGIAGTNGTLWDASHWDTSGLVLWEQNIGEDDLPELVSKVVDGSCYGRVVDQFMHAQDKLDRIHYHEAPAYTHLPDPVSAVTIPSYRDWPGRNVKDKEFWGSTEGRATLARLTPFGPRAAAQGGPMGAGQVSVGLGGGPPGHSPPPVPTPDPNSKVIYGPADQFLQPGNVDWLGPGQADSDSQNGPPGCKTFGPESPAAEGLGGVASLCACELTEPVLMYAKPHELWGPGQPSKAVAIDEDFLGGTGQGQWSMYFQDGTPLPRTVYRAVDELGERVHGDKAFAWRPSKDATAWNTPGSHQFAPTWNMLAPIPAGNVLPPVKQLTVRPSAASKYHFPAPYQHGMWVHTPFKEGADWTVATGTVFQVLDQIGATTKPVGSMWFSDGAPGEFRTLHVRFSHANGYWLLTGEAPPEWKHVDNTFPNQGDYARASLPSTLWSNDTTYDFDKHPESLYLAMHLGADSWHTSSDRWLTNYGNSFDGRQPPPRLGVGNPNHEELRLWAPSTFDTSTNSGYGPINDYEKRLELCKKFDPYHVDHHWPLVVPGQAFAGLYGHQAEKGDFPNTHFASSDLLGPHVVAKEIDKYPRLHEGMDVKWSYHEKFIDPAYRGIIGNIPDQYCFGESPFVSDLQYSFPCTPNELVDLCGDEADSDDGCSPWNRAVNNFKNRCKAEFDDCKDACSNGAIWLFSLGTGCILACTYDGVKTAAGCASAAIDSTQSLFSDYVGGAGCLVLTGQACSLDELVVKRRDDGAKHREIEIEMEYRAAYGNRDGKKSWCDATTSVSHKDGFPWVSAKAGTTITGACSWDQDGQYNAVAAGNHICVGLNKEFEPKGAFNTKTSGTSCGIRTDDGHFVNPFVFAPGAMHQRLGWTQRVATTMGEVGSFDATKQSIPILPEGISPKSMPPGAGFRLEFVGDAIIDCGHNPIRSEIHPPTNVLMHLSTPSMIHTKRYSLFGWARFQNPNVPTPFDLWPGPPPDKEHTKLAYRIVFPTGNATPQANLECKPYPVQAPNRIRCFVKDSGGPAGDPVACAANNSQRLFASCARAIGGGIVDVYWE